MSIFLSQIYRTQSKKKKKKKKEIVETTYSGCLINAQEIWTSSKWSQETTEDKEDLPLWLMY